MRISLTDAASAIGCPTTTPAVEVRGWSVDSRTVKSGDLFFALRGPVHDGHDYVARALEYPAVVAARPTLGTLNHTLLTLHALHGAGIPVAGVVFVETRPTEWGVIERDNRQTIAAQGDAAVLGTIPYVEDLDCCACAPASLLAAGLEMLRRLPVPR